MILTILRLLFLVTALASLVFFPDIHNYVDSANKRKKDRDKNDRRE